MDIQPYKPVVRRPVELVVHVNQSLDAGSRSRMEQDLVTHAGVHHARFNQQRPHLVVVGYDPRETAASTILAIVAGHRVEAQLIGGI